MAAVFPSSGQESSEAPAEVTVVANKNGMGTTAAVFNEQTNYVPRSTIITVSTSIWALNAPTSDPFPDLLGLLNYRLAGVDGPNNLGGQFVYYWKCIGRK